MHYSLIANSPLLFIDTVSEGEDNIVVRYHDYIWSCKSVETGTTYRPKWLQGAPLSILQDVLTMAVETGTPEPGIHLFLIGMLQTVTAQLAEPADSPASECSAADPSTT